MIIPESTNWEFRLSDDGRMMAFYDPGNGPWFVPVANMQGRFYDTVSLDFMKDSDGQKVDWVRFLPSQKAALEVLKIVTKWAEMEPVEDEAMARLVYWLGRKGYRLPEEGDDDE